MNIVAVFITLANGDHEIRLAQYNIDGTFICWYEGVYSLIFPLKVISADNIRGIHAT